MMRNLLILLLLISTPTSFAGSVQYPAPGNIDLREGTLEIWITPQTTLYLQPPPEEYRNILSLFAMDVPDHFSFSGIFYNRDKRSSLTVSMSHKRIKKAIYSLPGPAVDWRDSQQQLHHVAMTWKGRVMYLYADGILIGSRLQASPFTGKLAGVTLTIGHHQGRDTPMILHAVRTSNIARSAKNLKNAQPVIDIHTLMVDRYGGDEKQTHADLISGYTGEIGGVKVGHCIAVKGRTPGIALFRKLKANKENGK